MAFETNVVDFRLNIDKLIDQLVIISGLLTNVFGIFRDHS